MFKETSTLFRAPLLSIAFAFIFIFTGMVDNADARSRSGGRSFGGSKSFSGSYNKSYNKSPSRSSSPYSSKTANPTQRSSSSFMRGVAGGLLGGFIGNMLFGGIGHGMGMGGFGGSGFGLIELLLMGGLLYFLYKLFLRRQAPSPLSDFQGHTGSGGSYGSWEDGSGQSRGIMDVAPADPLAEGLHAIQMSDPGFDPEEFKEIAQDVFFKVQAAWMRRDITSIKNLMGKTLATEYKRHFEGLKQKGHLNRLENISVRKVDIVDAGAEGNEEYVTVLFTANLLDYTVDEASGNIVEGDPTEPVKFAEKWTFARQIGTPNWKLEGIHE